jgi:CheY-like chemotaxis protein
MRERILIIDESAGDRELLKLLLEPEYDVDCVDDGLPGIELVKQRDYTCVLVDLHLPIFGGTALIDYWQALSPEILPRVIIVTGFFAMAAALRERIADVILKPFAAAHVLECVERRVALRRMAATEG